MHFSQTFLWDFVHKLNEIGLDKDLGLSLLLDFVKATRAKASFFTLLNREPRLRDDLAWLFSTSPYLANIIASRPELIDSFLLRTQQPLSEDLNSLLEELAERRLLSELISANRFLSDRNLSRNFVRISPRTLTKFLCISYENYKKSMEILNWVLLPWESGAAGN